MINRQQKYSSLFGLRSTEFNEEYCFQGKTSRLQVTNLLFAWKCRKRELTGNGKGSFYAAVTLLCFRSSQALSELVIFQIKNGMIFNRSHKLNDMTYKVWNIFISSLKQDNSYFNDILHSVLELFFYSLTDPSPNFQNLEAYSTGHMKQKEVL